MRMSNGRRVVVGVNETYESQRALEWAVAEAELRHGLLHIVAAHAWSEPRVTGGHLALPALPEPPLGVRERLDRALAYARDRLDAERVTGELHSGVPVPALRRASETAELLVVGTRGRATRHSVSRAVAAHADCPVVVVRDWTSTTPPHIVVGVDHSLEADRALALAFEEAELHGATVEAVRCWLPYGPDAGYSAWIEATGRNLQAQLADSVGPYRRKYPRVPVIEQVLEGAPAEQLALRSEKADLVVVGSRGHGRVVGAMLGSVSQGVLARAHCPVAVVKNFR